MKRTREEILTKFREIVGDDNTSDEVLAFVEDVADTIVEDDYERRYNEMVERYNENDAAWRKKYRDRFEQPITPDTEEPDNRDPSPEAKTYTYDELFKED